VRGLKRKGAGAWEPSHRGTWQRGASDQVSYEEDSDMRVSLGFWARWAASVERKRREGGLESRLNRGFQRIVRIEKGRIKKE
jgi:hypothetical protein